jgi:hypothetical protein
LDERDAAEHFEIKLRCNGIDDYRRMYFVPIFCQQRQVGMPMGSDGFNSTVDFDVKKIGNRDP